MRILMWLSIGFAAASAVCAYLCPIVWVLPLGAIALAAAVASFHFQPMRRLGMALIGCVLGFTWFFLFFRFYLLPAASMEGVEVEATVTASDYSIATQFGTRVDGRIDLEGRGYQIRVYLDDAVEIEPGDRIRGKFRFVYAAPDEDEMSFYNPGKGIFLLGYQSDAIAVTDAVKTDIWAEAAILRNRIREILRHCFPEDVFPFVQALLLGDGSDLSYETDTSFKISGIRHIIAVSGLHVSILYGFVSTLSLRRRWLTAMLTLPTLLIFAAVAGFTPSVTRACIMVGLMVLAQTAQREYDSPTALGFACLVMLIGNPLVITSVGFQLSAGCVAGILMFSERIMQWIMGHFGKVKGKGIRAKTIRWFASSVSVTLGAMSITTPLSAIYFGSVSLIGVVTNLLTLWVINLIFNGMIITCAVGVLSMNIAALLGKILAYPIRFVLITARVLSKVPMAAVYTKSIYIVLWLVFVYIMLAVLLIRRKRKPGLMITCAAVGLCLSLLLSWLEPLVDHTRVTVLDVGQGQSILLQTGGRTYLVDCGGDSDERTADIIAETLLSQGISHLDGIIITHTDRDHAGGLENLLTRIDADVILIPGTERAWCISLRKLTSGQVIPVNEDLEITFCDASIQVFAPIFAKDSNENSLCVLFTTEKCAILVTGDRSGFGERALLRRRELPDVDVLIAGHHGAADATCEELLQAVRPETVIISVGKDNYYGHPAPKLLERLKVFGCQVYRTDENGTIYYRR